MQMWEFLVLPAIDDKTICGEMVLGHERLRGRHEVRQERVGRIEALP